MRVLIVEDEVRLARNIASVLTEVASFAVDVSHDGEDGRHMAMTTPYDLILHDLMLPVAAIRCCPPIRDRRRSR